MNELNNTINIKTMYEVADVLDKDIMLEITEFNIKIFDILNKVLYNQDELTDYEILTLFFCRLLKRSNQEMNVNVEEVLQVIDEDSKELLKEFKNKKDPLNSLIYLIGTNSEIPQNYTMTERMIIVSAIAKLRGINLTF